MGVDMVATSEPVQWGLRIGALSMLVLVRHAGLQPGGGDDEIAVESPQMDDADAVGEIASADAARSTTAPTTWCTAGGGGVDSITQQPDIGAAITSATAVTPIRIGLGSFVAASSW